MTETRANYRTARLVAVVAGLLGTALAVLTPLLPVTQTTAQLNWPQNGVLNSVTAPLISYVATDLDISVPCRRRASSTHRARRCCCPPSQAGAQGGRPRPADPRRANDDLVVVVRNTPVVVAPLSRCSARSARG